MATRAKNRNDISQATCAKVQVSDPGHEGPLVYFFLVIIRGTNIYYIKGKAWVRINFMRKPNFLFAENHLQQFTRPLVDLFLNLVMLYGATFHNITKNINV